MGRFSRLSDILSANVNALLDKVENPERMLNQLIREMEQALAAARQGAVAVVAEERRLARELDHHREAAEAWRSRARLALKHGREDLARLSLTRRFEHLDLITTLEKRHAEAQENSAETRAGLHTLEQRLADARRRLQRLRSERQTGHVRASTNAVGADPRSPFARFALLERHLAELQDDLIIHAEFGATGADAELTRLEREQRLITALAELKETTSTVGSAGT